MQFIINPYVYDVKNVYISIHKHFEQVKNLTIYFHSYLLNLWKERQRYKKIELCYCINTYVCYRVLKYWSSLNISLFISVLLNTRKLQF